MGKLKSHIQRTVGADLYASGIHIAKNGQHEIHVEMKGQFPFFRRFRADTLDDLLKVTIAELKDSPLTDYACSELCAVAREAIYEAQDAEAPGK